MMKKQFLLCISVLIASISYAQTAIDSTNVEKGVEDPVYVVVDKAADFPGEQQALFNYLSKHIKYPRTAQDQAIEGRVICQFVIEKDGSVTNINVIQSSEKHY